MADDGFIVLGDALWLDFVNTARGRSLHPPDRLSDAADFARWCRLLHLEADPGLSLEDIHGFRARLTELAESLHRAGQPSASAVAALNAQLALSAGRHQLTRVGGDWQLRFAPERPPRALEALTRSAAATLTNPALAVRRCAGEHCSLFFTDDSDTGHRRWCDAAACGRHARVERRRSSLR